MDGKLNNVTPTPPRADRVVRVSKFLSVAFITLEVGQEHF